MAQLPLYTNTYADVDGSIMDADDLVDEFYRVAYFLALWADGGDAIDVDKIYETYIEEITGELAEILPSNGLIQRLDVAAGVETFEVQINEHTVGAPFRVFISIRCGSPDTRFTLSVPSGEAHIFGINRSVYMPSQVIGDGAYSASIICTYGSEKGVMVQVMAGNPEETEVDYDDVMTAVPI